jgi:hypothetical protein
MAHRVGPQAGINQQRRTRHARGGSAGGSSRDGRSRYDYMGDGESWRHKSEDVNALLAILTPRNCFWVQEIFILDITYRDFWAQVTFLGVGTARAGERDRAPEGRARRAAGALLATPPAAAKGRRAGGCWVAVHRCGASDITQAK